MPRSLGALFAFAFLFLAAAGGQARAVPIPPPVQAMIAAAAGDPDKLRIVADLARQTQPDSIEEIDALVEDYRADFERKRVDMLSSYTLREGWTGQGEAGGSLATGNTDESGLTLGLNLNKETLFRRHRFNALIDAKSASGVQTAQRYVAGYQGDYKFTERAYSNLLASWEKDPFAGLEHRLSESVGVGYRFLHGGAMTLDIDIGVAARQTWYADGATDAGGNPVEVAQENTVGGRVGTRYEWKIAPETVLTNVASTYVDSQSNTVESATALTTKLMGHLSWRASLNVRYESDPPAPREQVDTLTRFSLVYAF